MQVHYSSSYVSFMSYVGAVGFSFSCDVNVCLPIYILIKKIIHGKSWKPTSVRLYLVGILLRDPKGKKLTIREFIRCGLIS